MHWSSRGFEDMSKLLQYKYKQHEMKMEADLKAHKQEVQDFEERSHALSIKQKRAEKVYSVMLLIFKSWVNLIIYILCLAP